MLASRWGFPFYSHVFISLSISHVSILCVSHSRDAPWAASLIKFIYHLLTSIANNSGCTAATIQRLDTPAIKNDVKMELIATNTNGKHQLKVKTCYSCKYLKDINSLMRIWREIRRRKSANVSLAVATVTPYQLQTLAVSDLYFGSESTFNDTRDLSGI